MRGRSLAGILLTLSTLLSIGCGGGGDDGPTTTSQEDLTEFLQENPEYTGTPPGPSASKSPLSLE